MRLFVLPVIVFFLSLSAFSETKKRFLFLGDSLTAGYGVSSELCFVGLFKTYLEKKRPEMEVLNSGVSGSTTASCKGRLNWQLKTGLDYLFIALGANDGLRGTSWEASYKNLDECIELAKSKNVKVILAGMMLPSNYGEKYRENFSAIYPKLAAKHNISKIDFLLEGVAGVAEFNLPDGIHPNEKGHKKIFDKIQKNLESIL